MNSIYGKLNLVDLGFLIYAFIISLGSGILAALIGSGGGIILVPLIISLFKAPLHVASSVSIITVLATSSAASVKNFRNNLINLRLGIFLVMPASFGAISGVFLSSTINENILKIFFSASLLYTIGVMYFQDIKTDSVRKQNDELAKQLRLGSHFFNAVTGEEIVYSVSKTKSTFAFSYIAGMVSGILGIGGSGIIVPALNLLNGIPMKAAVATSNMIMGAIAATTALHHIRNPYFDVFFTAPLVLGSLFGASIGASISNRIKGVMLKRFLIIILTISAIRMMLSGLGV